MEANGHFHAPAALIQEKESPVPIEWRLVGPKSRSERGGEEKKIPSLSLLGI
jgi:hypothetical protein